MCPGPHIILCFINTILNDVLLVECADTDYDNKFGSNSTHVDPITRRLSNLVLHNLHSHCDFLYSRM